MRVRDHLNQFSFLKLDTVSKVRWTILDAFVPGASGELLGALSKAFDAEPLWSLAEDISQYDFRSTLARDPSPVVVVDCLHHHDKNALLPLIKQFLVAAPQKRFFFLGNGILRGVQFPDYYGQGEYISCEDNLTHESSRDDTALLQHAFAITPKYGLDDLVLTPKAKMRFQECLDYIRTKEICEKELGFRDRHSRGHGVTLLFHGASGTGKTMAAEVVAATLGFPLYQVDLSSVISKWVGETEKNLKSIFRAARGVRGILLFDEGDAIFGQRTEVKDSQDRYSNIEVNYLLQELERFDGICILSTNHEKSLDSAFLRRFTYSLTFGLPSSTEREKIWKANVPQKLPLGKTVDFAHLSLFRLSGGNIKNCIRDAAAIALSRNRHHVEQIDLLWGIKRELQKHGLELSREVVGEEYWKQVASEWEFQYFKRAQPKEINGEPRLQ